MKLVAKDIYTLEIHDRGTSLDQFLSCTKPYLVANAILKISSPNVSQVVVDYVVQTPTNDVLWDMMVKTYQRKDGQYVYKGDFVPSEFLMNKMREVVKILTVYLTIKES